jgi:hypothetical protein
MLEQIEEDTLPHALMIGVDYDLFWTLNPKSLSPFIKAFELKQDYEDELAWRLGAYVKVAITSSLGDSKYPEKPFSKKGIKRDMSPAEIKEKMMVNAEIINARLEAKGGSLDG